MSQAAEARAPAPFSPDRLLRVFGRVEAGEAGPVLLLLANLFVLLVAYYVLKTVREPLILLSGGAELKSYAAAAQAAILVAFVPAYSWLSSKVSRARLIVVMVTIFVLSVELFYLGSRLRVPHLGFVFYVWVGIFNVASIAMFWSYANDLHAPADGERLFPVIALGATLGSPVGSKIAETLFSAGVPTFELLHVSAALLVVHLALYRVVESREREARRAPPAAPPLRAGPGGFGLVLRSRYLGGIAALLVILNVVNTIGEYILGRSVVATATAAAASSPGLDVASYIGAFYGNYFFWVNVAAVALQAFVVSRLVKHLGLTGVLLALPVVAFGAYALVAAGAGLAAIRWAKTAENSVDYSVMNTGKQMLWLPTTREEKYKAKQAIDAFFFRAGDVLAAGVVFAGTRSGAASLTSFAAVNLVLVAVWVAIALRVLHHYRSRCSTC
ncbi:MAG TPA: translocase [Anaeromyxobacteraceae bacterium]|nr:translocase [Anaeromyxobacteraceae bacterium]